jgi:thymidylate kinase
MVNIAITGTHGTGKSTLSYSLAAYYKQQGRNVKIIQEVARTCPFPINKGMTREAAKWIYLEHFKKELEAQSKHEIVIGDRSVYDSFAYAKYFHLCDYALATLESLAFQHLYRYDKVIFVRPDLPLHDDGTRSSDHEFQSKVDEIFSCAIKMIPHIEIKSSQIFDKEQSWMQYCL